jgi:hypothetical protein
MEASLEKPAAADASDPLSPDGHTVGPRVGLRVFDPSDRIREQRSVDVLTH